MVQSTPVVQTGAHALLSALEARGATYLFGVPGHGAYPIYNALCDFPTIAPFVGRHEQTSAFSALGYAWSTGEIAVATSVPEAGLTNAATGLLEATLAQERILFVLEEHPSHRPILDVVARYYRRVDSLAGIAPAVNELVDLLKTGRPGVAGLEITNQALNAALEAAPTAAPSTAPTPVLPSAAIDEAAGILSRARRIVIVAGATASGARAGAAVLALAERLQAPVLVDGFAKGLVPEDHPLALGCCYAPTSPAEDLLQAADLVLVIGTPQGKSAIGKRSAEQLSRQLILVDWDDRDQKGYPARVRVQGPVPVILSGLLDALEPTVAAEGFDSDQIEAARRFVWEAASERIPWAIPFYRGLRAALPRDGILLTDSLAALWADRLFPAYAENTIRFPQGTGTLGWGSPAAVGVKAAHPDREVVVLAGDGAFLYNPQELATMQLYRQKLTMIVANDNCYSAIKHNMNENFGRSTAYELANPDFVRFGEAFGMRAVRLETPDAIEDALREALAGDQSTLIEVPLELMPPKRFTQ